MDFWMDMAVAVLLRVIKDRRGITKWYDALAKVYAALLQLAETDPNFGSAVYRKIGGK